jgi:hypothetical protein
LHKVFKNCNCKGFFMYNTDRKCLVSNKYLQGQVKRNFIKLLTKKIYLLYNFGTKYLKIYKYNFFMFFLLN